MIHTGSSFRWFKRPRSAPHTSGNTLRCKLSIFANILATLTFAWLLTMHLSCLTTNLSKSTAPRPIFEVEEELTFSGSPGQALSIDVGDEFLTREFAISMQLRIPDQMLGNLGDALAFIDEDGSARGVLSLLNNSAACTSQSNTRNLLFGLNSGAKETWEDMGRPANAILVFALAVFDGDLYAGSFEAGGEEKGRVHRYLGNGIWEDCGAPWNANAITSLAVHNGRLYAASSRYHEDDPRLSASSNQADGGELFRYEGGKTWTNCGKIGPAEFVFGMASAGEDLLITLMDSPRRLDSIEYGLYSYHRDGSISFLGNPGGRVAAITVAQGKAWVTGYDGPPMGGLFTYSNGEGWKSVGSPPNVSQSYSMVTYRGRLHIGTWPEGTVYGLDEASSQFSSLGRLGQEDEVMGMMVYNGALYAGTLPSADVYRFLPGQGVWKQVGTLDSATVGRRRAWGMAIYRGKLICSTLPTGRVLGMELGEVLTYDRSLDDQWHHVIVQRRDDQLELFMDGQLVARCSIPAGPPPSIKSRLTLSLGAGPQGPFRGGIRKFGVYNRALQPQPR